MALLLAGWTSPARAIDPFFPTYGNDGIDVRHYELRLDVDAGTHRIAGRAVLLVRAERQLASFTLDLDGLTVDRVQLDGMSVRFRRTPGKLVVEPPTPVAGGRTFSLAVTYGGVPRPVADPTAEPPDSVPGLGWTNYRDVSYVVSEPVGAGNWYPVNDEPTDKASYRFVVTVEEPYTVVANGVPVAESDLGAKRRFVWEQRQPMASYLAITDIGRFRLDLRRSASGVPVRTYLTKNTPAASIAALRRTPAMIDFLEGSVGRYPFDGYGAVMVDDPDLYYALETQGMSTFQSSYVDELTVVHELAHQWFGDSLTVARWGDLWLAEGFATYVEHLWNYRGNRTGLEAAIGRLHASAVANKIGPAVVDRPQDIFADNTYYRGALTLHALRLEVGNTRFWRILRTWYRTQRNGNVTSAEFIATAAGIGGPTVRPLLQAWLYQEPVPSLPGAASVAALSAAAPAEPPVLGIGVRHRRGS